MKKLFLFFALFLLFQIAFSFMLNRMEKAAGTRNIPDTRLYYQPRQIQEFFQQLGTEGRLWYRRTLYLDLIYPLVYGSLLATVLQLLLTRPGVPGWARRLLLLPFLAVLFDYLENGLELYMLGHFPEEISLPARLAGSLVTPAKWLTIAACLLTMATLGVYLLVRKKASKENSIRYD